MAPGATELVYSALEQVEKALSFYQLEEPIEYLAGTYVELSSGEVQRIHANLFLLNLYYDEESVRMYQFEMGADPNEHLH